MNAIAAIRTNKWTEAEIRLLADLQDVFGPDVAVVFHNRPQGLQLPVPVVDINDDWVTQTRLRVSDDWGWRCGDYFYYALRAAKPDYAYYWLIEPDVLFTGNPTPFFAAFSDRDDDVLGVRPGPLNEPKHPFIDRLKHLGPYRAIFALTRFSGRALDKLLPLRQDDAIGNQKPRRMSNDELFTFTHVNVDPELTIGDLASGAPDWFEHGVVETNPDMLQDAILSDPTLRDSVFHPVLSRASYKQSLADRLTSRTNVLNRSLMSMQHLDDGDLEDIAEMARTSLLSKLKFVHGQSRALAETQD